MALPFLILSATGRAPALAHGPGVYRPGGAHRTFSAALALAIAGGVGATLVLALVVPAFVETEAGGMTAVNIPMPSDPPPPKPVEQEQTPPDRSVITVPPRDTPVPPTNDDNQIVRELLPPLDPGTVIGTDPGGGSTLVADPPRLPVFHVAQRDSRFARNFQPAYPSARERDGIEGRCPVTVTIAASGRVTNVVSNGCTDSAFYAATERQALRHWRFRPATRDGVAVESTQDIAVSFRIPD